MNFRYKIKSHHDEIIVGYGNLANIIVAVKENKLRSIPVPSFSGLTHRKRSIMNWNLKSALYRMFWVAVTVIVIVFVPKLLWFGVVLIGFNCFMAGVYVESYISSLTKRSPDVWQAEANPGNDDVAPSG